MSFNEIDTVIVVVVVVGRVKINNIWPIKGVKRS